MTTHIARVILAGFILTGALAQAFANDEGGQFLPFRILPQALDKALMQFSDQSGIQLVVTADTVRGKSTKGVTGTFEPSKALAMLLEDSGLQYQMVNPRSFAIRANGEHQSTSATETSSSMQLAQTSQSLGSPSSQAGSAKSAGEPSALDGSGKEDNVDPPKIQEIVVTAQKREERLQDVPMSITAKSGEELVKAGIRNLHDLSFAVPGLTVAEYEPGRQAIAIRGIYSNRGDTMLTGIYLDEIPISGMQTNLGGGADVRTVDLARVEVLKGPQGTLFGEGAAGGVVRFVTNDPDLSRFGGELSGSFYGTKNGGESQEVNGIVNVPLVDDMLGVRIAGTYENRGGWIDQIIPNGADREDINDGEVKHVRAKALYTPLPGLALKGLIEIHRNDGGGTNTLNQLPYERSAFVAAFDPTAPMGFSDNYDIYNLTITYDLGFAELLSSTSRVKADSLRVVSYMTVPEQPAQFETLFGVDANQTITNQEVRLTSATDGPFHWTTGAVYKDVEANSTLGSTGQSAILFGYTSGSPLVLTGLGANQLGTRESESWATFADMSYELFDRLEIGGGLRYFRDAREGFGKNTVTGLPIGASLSANFDKLTWRVIAKYKPSENINFYTNIGTGFRSGTFNSVQAIQNGFPTGVGPEEITSYEVGAKMSLLDKRLNVNAAAFYSEYDNMLGIISVYCPTCVNPVINVTANSQFAVIKGIEADIGWAATEHLTLSLAGERVDSEIVKLLPSFGAGGAPVPQFYQVGDHVNLIPEYNLSATADYRFHWVRSTPGSFLLTLNQLGTSWAVDRGNSLFLPHHIEQSAPEKTFLNASIGAEWNDWELSLFGRNLLDERAIIAPYSGGMWTPQARPRTVGVIIRKTF